MSPEERATTARAHVDALATRVGTAPEVQQDELAQCDMEKGEGGLELVYFLRVSIASGAADELTGVIADDYETNGWQVTKDPVDPDNDEVSVRFSKDGYTMGAAVSESAGIASVFGSGGCVP